MAFYDVTNKAQGPRVFQCAPAIEGAPPDAVTLNPGEARTLELVDRNHPVLRAWAAAGEVTFILTAGKPKA